MKQRILVLTFVGGFLAFVGCKNANVLIGGLSNSYGAALTGGGASGSLAYFTGSSTLAPAPMTTDGTGTTMAGYIAFTKNSSAPVQCTAALNGAMAMTVAGDQCNCVGNGNTWAWAAQNSGSSNTASGNFDSNGNFTSAPCNWSCTAHGSQVVSTSTVTTANISSGCTRVYFALWGGGGGGGSGTMSTGGAAFVLSGNITVPANQPLYIAVGTGGNVASAGAGGKVNGATFGGAGGSISAGGGGAFTGLFSSSSLSASSAYAVAAGGGGGSNFSSSYGGYGALTPSDGGGSGPGFSGTSGGAGGSNTTNGYSGSNTLLFGGNGASATMFGGGGGAGYVGGGGGGAGSTTAGGGGV